MVTEQTRKDIWDEMLDVARLVRYYEALSDQHRRKHLTIRYLLIASAVSGTAALLELFPDQIQDVIQIFAGCAIGLIAAWDIVTNYARKAAVLHAISKECSLLEIEWRDLWAEANNNDSDDAKIRSENRYLAKKLSEVTGWAGDADVQENRKLNEECETTAHKVMEEKYATY